MEEMKNRLWLESLSVMNHSEDLGLEGRIILIWVLGTEVWCMDWIHLAEDRGRWRAVVNTVTNLRFFKARNFLSSLAYY
jgi:hypothetical protein